MEHGRRNRVPLNGSDIAGAIFMCNKGTVDESFKRNLFGLHSKHSDFVKLVRAGMILFLFEPEERKLNGVFRATSDGAMNIVPDAFSSSNKRYPAQVCFERLYNCRPLAENEFCEAIKKNYVTFTIFNFALSSEQVYRLIQLFTLKSAFPNDQIPKYTKLSEKYNLDRKREIGNAKILKFEPDRINMNNNSIQSTMNTVSRYRNHDNHDITLPNDIISRQPYPVLSHDQLLSTPGYDPIREPSSYCSSSQPFVDLGLDHAILLENKFNFCTDSFLDSEAPHMRNHSYTSAPHLELEYFNLTKPAQPTLYPPEGHINVSGFNQNEFSENLHPLSERLHSMASPSLCFENPRTYSVQTLLEEGSLSYQDSPSLCLGNHRVYSQQALQEDGSLSYQNWPSSSLPDYDPIIKDETLVNYSYDPRLEDETVDRNKYDYHSGFANDTNFRAEDSFDFIHNYNSSASVSNKFSQSDTIHTKCSVFGRLSRPSKNFKDPSLVHMLESLHRRSARFKVNPKPDNSGNFKARQLDNTNKMELLENQSLAETKPQMEEFDENNGFRFSNFKRRSTVKQTSSGVNDLDKCKRRKIIRPSFTEEHQNQNFQCCEGSEKLGNLGLPSNTIQDERRKPTIDAGGNQHVIDLQSELCEKFPVDLAVHESDKVRKYSICNLSKENSRDLPLDSLVLTVEGHNQVIDNSPNVVSVITASPTIDVGDDQHTFNWQSEASEKCLDEPDDHESDKINKCSIDDLDRNLKENSRDLALGSAVLLVEAQYNVTYNSSLVASTKNSSPTVDIGGNQHKIDCLSEVHENIPVDPAVNKSDKVSNYSSACLDGKSNGNVHDLPLDSLHKVTKNSTDMVSTSNTSISNGLTEEESACDSNVDEKLKANARDLLYASFVLPVEGQHNVTNYSTVMVSASNSPVSNELPGEESACESNVDGKLKASACNLLLDSFVLPVEGRHKVTNYSTNMVSANNSPVCSELPEEESACESKVDGMLKANAHNLLLDSFVLPVEGQQKVTNFSSIMVSASDSPVSNRLPEEESTCESNVDGKLAPNAHNLLLDSFVLPVEEITNYSADMISAHKEPVSNVLPEVEWIANTDMKHDLIPR